MSTLKLAKLKSWDDGGLCTVIQWGAEQNFDATLVIGYEGDKAMRRSSRIVDFVRKIGALGYFGYRMKNNEVKGESLISYTWRLLKAAVFLLRWGSAAWRNGIKLRYLIPGRIHKDDMIWAMKQYKRISGDL